MGKCILVLYSGDDWDLDQPAIQETYNNGYKLWNDICRKEDIQLVRSEVGYFSGQHFEKYWQITDGVWKKFDEVVKPDVVFDKAGVYKNGSIDRKVQTQKLEIAKQFPMLNYPEFSNLFENKLNQAVVFSNFLPKSFYLAANSNLSNAWDKAVIKGLYGSGGENVEITDAKTILVDKTSLVQEFVDGHDDQGVLQDYRIQFLGNEPQLAYRRRALKNSLYTNISKGASMHMVDLDSIPKLLGTSSEVIRPLQIFPKKIFSVDFLVEKDTQKPYLMEINTMPGFGGFDRVGKDEFSDYLNKLTKYLLEG